MNIFSINWWLLNKPDNGFINEILFLLIFHIKSIIFSTLPPGFTDSFFDYGPFIVGFTFTSLFVWPPNICFALAIFNFYSGVMNFFFYSGFAGGITTTGDFFTGPFYSGFTGDSYFFTLNLLIKFYSLEFVAKGKDCVGDFCSYGVNLI